MLYAVLSSGQKILPTKHERAYCPCCRGEVVAKCGEINAHHWAHKSNKDCDEWYENESKWHLEWKNLFPPENVEVTISKGGKWHRADVVGNNETIIELQHSPISPEIIRERENFYENMLWIFDERNNYELKDQVNDREFLFSWKSMTFSITACKKPFYFDNGDELFMVCVTKLSYKKFTGYFVDKDKFILEHGGSLKPAT